MQVPLGWVSSQKVKTHCDTVGRIELDSVQLCGKQADGCAIAEAAKDCDDESCKATKEDTSSVSCTALLSVVQKASEVKPLLYGVR